MILLSDFYELLDYYKQTKQPYPEQISASCDKLASY